MPKPKKKAWLAGLLSFLIEGMGQIYNRQYAKGILLFILGMTFSILPYWTSYWLYLVFVPIWIYAIYDAYKTAKKTIQEEPFKHAIWITIVVFVIFTVMTIAGILAYWSATFVEKQSIGVPSTKTVEPTKSKIISIYIDSLPFDIDQKYANSIREARSFWEKQNPNLIFRETDKQNADVYVTWIKEFGGYTLGHVIKKDFVQIGLGDSSCLNKWRPYTYETVLLIAKHELGHVIGLEHSNDPNDIMYSSLTTKYEVDIDESDVLPDGWKTFYPVCTKRTATLYSIEITSTEGLDVYVVPSRENYELFTKDMTFSHYSNCEGNNIATYKKTCAIPMGGGIILRNPTVFGLGQSAQFTIKAKEV